MEQRRNVLITGANRGLGLHLAQHLAKSFNLILTSRNLESLQEIKKQLEEKIQNPKIFIHQLDVTDQQSIQNLYNWLSQENLQLDVLVNNAGVNLGSAKHIINTNVFGVINLSEQLLPLLKQDAKIVIISSQLGLIKHQQDQKIQQFLTTPQTKESIIKKSEDLITSYDEKGDLDGWTNIKYGVYDASKALINAYGRYILSQLVGDQQSVFLIHPGWVQTDMGGPQAPCSKDEGIKSSSFVIESLPFGRDEKYHGHYFNNKAEVEDY